MPARARAGDRASIRLNVNAHCANAAGTELLRTVKSILTLPV